MAEDFLSDTIAAIATAPGRSAVALVRVAGPAATSILGRITDGVERPQARLQRLLPIHHPETGELVDRALVSYFPTPASYTGDDVVEISTHGGLLTPQLVLAAVIAAGARAALPGEFTRRAYLNGKLDLLQAEAILDMIDGHSPALHRAAVFQLERGLSTRIEELRHAILGVEALLIYSIDFPEEDEPPVPPLRIVGEATGVIERIDRLLATAPEGEMLREGALVVLAGRPNSGKSSLFNALLGAERAIVTDVPGTTRDALEAQITIEGYPFRLVDTAGLRATADRVEGIGIEVARRFLRAARRILFCAPAGRPLDPEELDFLGEFAQQRVVRVRTMADLLPADSRWEPGRGDASGEAEVLVSATAGSGLERLRERLLEDSFGEILETAGEAPLITRERHARALHIARDEIVAFLEAMEAEIPMEVCAVHLRAAVEKLEEVIGAVTTEDLLGRVFGDFCVGK
jgi:tRNA modification GTPase